MKLLLILSLALATFTPTANADTLPHPDSELAESLVPESLESRIRREIARLEIRQSFKFFDGELFDGVTAGLKYRYELEPSFKGDYHLRMDRWEIEAALRPGDLLDDYGKVRIGLNIERGAEVLFIRPFKSKGDSAKALPYTPARIPFTAEKALKELEVGEIVALQSELNFVVGARTIADQMSVPVSVATHYIISGEFQVHVVKKSKNEVRLKLIGLRQNRFRFGGSIGWGENDFKVTGVKIVDRRLEKWFDATEVFKLSTQKSKANIVMVDYVLNLTEPEVAKAYESVMNSVFTLKATGLSNPLGQEKGENLISDITPLERIFERQRSIDEDNRIVNRIFKGRNDIQLQEDTSLQFGVLVFKIGAKRQYIENILTAIEEDESRSYYRLHTFQQIDKSSAFFGYWRKENLMRASILFDANEDLEINGLRNIVFEWDHRDKKLSNRDQRALKDSIRQNIPEPVYNLINWDNWKEKKSRVNGRVLMTSMIHPDALKQIGSRGYSEIRKAFEAYLLSIPAPKAVPNDMHQDPDMMPSNPTVVDIYENDIHEISIRMEEIFNESLILSYADRAAAFGALRNNELFLEVGAGFILHLLPLESLGQYLYFKLSVVADKEAPINFEWGQPQDRRIYDAAAYIRAVLSQRSVDLAIEAAK